MSRWSGSMSVIAAAAVRRVLCHIGRSTAILTAECQTLKHAQQDEDDGRRNTDLCGTWQNTDHKGREAHDQNGDEEGVFASDDIAETAENQSAERTHEKARRKGQQREDVARRFRILAEEVRADIDGERTIEIEVIPFEDRTERRGENDLLLLPVMGRAFSTPVAAIFAIGCPPQKSRRRIATARLPSNWPFRARCT